MEKPNKQYLRKAGKAKGLRRGAGKHKIPNTRHLTRILNILKENPQGLIYIEIIELTNVTNNYIKEALLWLCSNGLIVWKWTKYPRKVKGGNVCFASRKTYFLKKRIDNEQ